MSDPRITDEMVEAAVDVVMDDGHNGLDCRPDRNLGLTVRAALEAALLPLAPQPSLPACPNCEGEHLTCGSCGIVLDATPQPVIDRDVWFGPLTALLRRRLELSAKYPTFIAEDADEIVDAVLALLNGTAK